MLKAATKSSHPGYDIVTAQVALRRIYCAHISYEDRESRMFCWGYLWALNEYYELLKTNLVKYVCMGKKKYCQAR